MLPTDTNDKGFGISQQLIVLPGQKKIDSLCHSGSEETFAVFA